MEATWLKQNLEQSGLFDKDWYLATYPDVSCVDLEPLEHFVKYGIVLGRDPGPNFDTEYYLAKYPDVVRSNLNPLQHYFLHGFNEGRIAWKCTTSSPHDSSSTEPVSVGNFHVETDMHDTEIGLHPKPNYEKTGYNLEQYPATSCLTLPVYNCGVSVFHRRPDVGIHLHLHYVELAEEFIEFLGNIDFAFSLYVSVTDSQIVDAVAERFRQELPRSTPTVRLFPNKGRDIAPLICGFGQELLSHEIIGHIHSKISPHNTRKADWRNQLLTYLMGSKATVNRLIRHFEESQNIGMMFPVYHHSLNGQISWGTNFEICKQIASRINLQIDKSQMHLFPAGSMFWARSAALKPLLQAGLKYTDFPAESGQTDGTIAHAIERLFGEVVHQSGFDIVQIKSEKPYNLTHYYPSKWPFRERTDISQVILDYQQKKKPNNKIAVFTAITGGYDQPVRHEHLDPEIDYIIFSDSPVENYGFWQVRPIDFWHPEDVRVARRIKTNPHIYLEGYDIAVWIDANVVIRGNIRKYIQKLHDTENAPLAGIPHPQRSCAYDEARTILEANRDVSGRVNRQMRAYEHLGFPKGAGLTETNFMVVNLKHPELPAIMANWWSQINKYSHRDQLSFNFVLWKQHARASQLMSENKSLRTNSDFAYLGHGKNSGYIKAPLKRKVKSETIDPLQFPGNEISPPEVIGKTPVDIIVCVHNALDETQQCLRSVIKSKRQNDSIIIIDDASNAATESYLKEFSSQQNAKLIRNNPPARGYCISANKGMKASSGKYFLLLNSDTLLTRSALENMIRAAEMNPTVGIVGPLSNAASTQSIPDIKGTSQQTAINEIPEGLSVEQMNHLCQQWAHPTLDPCVPLVHGFCQLIRKEVYEAIGGFDEQAFPEGYGEENDFCLRAADAGFNLKVATKSYVFHSKSASYTDTERRQRLMAEGSRKLREKHTDDRLNQAIRIMEHQPLLQSIRKKANDYFKSDK